MSVYTTVERDELVDFLRLYDVGELVGFEGISDGIENTNYFVTTGRQRMVLTLFETHTSGEMVFFLDLMAHLAEHGIPSAHPVADRQGVYLQTLKGKPAALVARLEGKSIDRPSEDQCGTLGEVLAKLHLAGASFTGKRENGRGPGWRAATAGKLYPCIDPGDASVLESEIGFQQQHPLTALPGGIVHADLFKDNTLWEDGHLNGIIDFYYACNDAYLYDIAIAVNDWCSDETGGLDSRRLHALTAAYNGVRAFGADESVAWPVALRAAALRFWISRLYDWHFPRPGAITHQKDPAVFRRIMLQRIEHKSDLLLNQ